MFRTIPTVTKNLLIINLLAFLATQVLQMRGTDLAQLCGLHFFMASNFHFYQFVSYLFLHANFMHLFSNMFGLWMFGCFVEHEWGGKKFLFYYILCGIGAGLCQELVQYVQYLSDPVLSAMATDTLTAVRTNSGVVQMSVDDYLNARNTIGASGAIYGVLLAFGMLFPRMVIGVPLTIIGIVLLDLVNTNVFIDQVLVYLNRLFFIAIVFAILIPNYSISSKLWRLLYTKPIEARLVIIGYCAIEILYIFKNVQGDPIAHTAHLGGMLFGYLMIRYWNSHPDSTYNRSRGQDFFERLKRDFEQRQGQRSSRQQSGRTNMHAERGGQTREDDMAYNARKKARQDEIDAILDKIRKSGYDSLTKEEKKTLFDASNER